MHAVQLAGEGLELLPGVLPLLEALAARDDVAVGLVTGNLEPIGWGAYLLWPARGAAAAAGDLARVKSDACWRAGSLAACVCRRPARQAGGTGTGCRKAAACAAGRSRSKQLVLSTSI